MSACMLRRGQGSIRVQHNRYANLVVVILSCGQLKPSRLFIGNGEMSWTVYVTRQRCEGNRGTAPLVLKVGARWSGQLYPMVALFCGRNSPISGRVYPEPNWTLWNRKPGRPVSRFLFIPILFFVFSCTLFVPLPWLSCIFAICLYLQHKTNIHAPGGIRTCNSGKRSLRPLGHWDGQPRDLLWLLVHIVT